LHLYETRKVSIAIATPSCLAEMKVTDFPRQFQSVAKYQMSKAPRLDRVSLIALTLVGMTLMTLIGMTLMTLMTLMALIGMTLMALIGMTPKIRVERMPGRRGFWSNWLTIENFALPM